MKMATWVSSPSVSVGCLLQDMRNLRHIFEDHTKCLVETVCRGRTTDGRNSLKVLKCFALSNFYIT